MRARLATAAFSVACVVAPSVSADEPPPPPTLDCALGLEGLRAQISALPGQQQAQENGFETVTVSAPDVWRVQIALTEPGQPAHPAIILRTFRKQVTGVWTADSRGCGFGNSDQFIALMADMKSEDTRLTNASRDEVEREKRGRSPLAP